MRIGNIRPKIKQVPVSHYSPIDAARRAPLKISPYRNPPPHLPLAIVDHSRDFMKSATSNHALYGHFVRDNFGAVFLGKEAIAGSLFTLAPLS